MQYTFVDDDVDAAPIYRCNGKASQPTRPHKNHGLHMDHISTWTESQCKHQMQSLVVPVQGSLANTIIYYYIYIKSFFSVQHHIELTYTTYISMWIQSIICQ